MSTKKKKTSISQIIFRILALVSLVVLVYAGWKLYGIWNENHQIASETEDLKQYLQTTPASADPAASQAPVEYFTVDWAGLQAANPNVVAWLAVPGTGISYPVVQTTDNTFYLDHSFTGAYNTFGAIFLDCDANPDFLDDNSIIYGHSISDVGGMFTALKDYTSLEFFESHPYFWLLTPNQNYRCTVDAFYQGEDGAAIYTTDFGDYENEVLQDIYQQAMYTRSLDLAGRHFVTLSTCNLDYGYQSDQRYVLMGMMQEWNELIPQSEVD